MATEEQDEETEVLDYQPPMTKKERDWAKDCYHFYTTRTKKGKKYD